MTDCEDAPMDWMQPSVRDPAVDRAAPEPARHELASGDYAMLAHGKSRDRQFLGPTWVSFGRYLMLKLAHVGHSPRMTGEIARERYESEGFFVQQRTMSRIDSTP